MKARVKETDEIVEVEQGVDFYTLSTWWKASNGKNYSSDDIELLSEWQCEKCGKIKMSSEFSKPYNGICKECEEMIDKEEWKQARIQAAIAAMQGLCANSNLGDNEEYRIAKWAIAQADALINELKKKKDESKS